MCPTLVVLYFYYHTAGVIPLECSSTYSCWVPRLSGICVMLQLRWGLQRQTGYSCYVHLNAPIWMFPEPFHRTELSLLHLSLHLNGWTHGCQTAFRFCVLEACPMTMKLPQRRKETILLFSWHLSIFALEVEPCWVTSLHFQCSFSYSLSSTVGICLHHNSVKDPPEWTPSLPVTLCLWVIPCFIT